MPEYHEIKELVTTVTFKRTPSTERFLAAALS